MYVITCDDWQVRYVFEVCICVASMTRVIISLFEIRLIGLSGYIKNEVITAQSPKSIASTQQELQLSQTDCAFSDAVYFWSSFSLLKFEMLRRCIDRYLT